MKRLVMSSAIALVMAVTLSTAAQAQFEEEEGVPPPPFRKGLWASVGGGWGSQGCSACTGRLDGISAHIVIGGTLSDQFLVGVGAGGWTTKADDGTQLTVLNADCRFRIYPTRIAHWFITVGAGVSTVSDALFPGFPDGEWGTSFLLGTGFDFRFASGMSLTPYIGINGAKTENLDANIAHAGIAITFH